MYRKKIQVTAPEGIHMAVAMALREISKKQEAHVFLKAKGRMVSARECQKVMALGVRLYDWVEVVVDSEEEEESEIMEQIERLLGCL